ncbi:DUF411 domain-containing protein [Plesiomonas shigelloides]|uniref:DUF411 domain-containing protein n=1 Tax=Plesiomonas shigelloides TaxID=703 RepID=UPI000DFD7802|nr:DUF411 domain-containing protein [Plesiomonas shigelloides]QIY09900.1 DUF411 domain-containing protein [Plesiomonas shigelloides]SUB63140.1 Protein of uncharacterised function, DUF [Plesiomonas shigelloides]
MKRALFAAALGLVSASGFAATTGITMYKSPSCGCCSEWAKHMQQAGYEVTTVMLDDNALYQLKQKHHITPELMSCHTAIVGDYAIEGHVPASDVARLLKEKPAISGISIPGMPVGSPGMEQGDRRDPYTVVTFDATGNRTAFSRHNGA